MEEREIEREREHARMPVLFDLHLPYMFCEIITEVDSMGSHQNLAPNRLPIREAVFSLLGKVQWQR